MPNEQISDFTALAVAPAVGDLLPIVDISDTTDAATGTTKKITWATLLALITGVIAKAPTTLTDAATVATDASLNNNFRVTLGGNRTLGNPTNALDGQVLTWEIIQDGTGSRTITLDTKFALGTDITAVTLTTTASKRDFLTVIYNSVADKFYVRGFIKGF